VNSDWDRARELYANGDEKMTFGFQAGSVPPNHQAQAVNICLIIAPAVETLIYSVPNNTIIWDHPDTQAVLVEGIANNLVNTPGYMSNGGDIKVR